MEASACERNLVLVCTFHALTMALVPVAVMPLFWSKHIDMSVTTILSVQAIFSTALALGEFPSGYLADRVGYRRSLFVAGVAMVLGWALYADAESLMAVIWAEVALGAGYSLVSGSDSALLYESLRALGRTSQFPDWYGRMRFWGQVSEGTSALCAGYLFTCDPRLPFLIEIPLSMAAAGAALAMQEPSRERQAPQPHLAHALKLVRFALVEHQALRVIIGFTVLTSLACYTPVWLWALYAREGGLPTEWLGPAWALSNYVLALGSLLSAAVSRRAGVVGAVGLCVLLIAVGYFGMGGTRAWYGFGFYYAFGLARGLSAPLLHAAEQEAIGSGDRAALVSLRSLLFRVSYVVVAPLVGAAVDRHGMHLVMLGLGAVYTVGLAALANKVRRAQSKIARAAVA